jgi:hypothetical protein
MQYVPLERMNASIRIHRCIIAIGRHELTYTDPQLIHPYVKDPLSLEQWRTRQIRFAENQLFDLMKATESAWS